MRFVIRRLLQAIPTFFGITILAFALLKLAPGDPIDILVYGNQDISPQDLAEIRRAYGLDQPAPVQYLFWLGRTLTGDLGQSIEFHRPVAQMLSTTLPNTIQLAAVSLVFAVTVGTLLGVAAALRKGSVVDQAIRVIGVLGHAIPSFWFGLVFILVFGVQLRLFPIGGMLSLGADPWDLGDRGRHLVGPVLTLSVSGIANYSRYVRAEMLEVLGQDFVRTAHAKGLRPRTVVFAHALRNALLPVITALGGLLAWLISGAVVVEQIFAWPGMGRMSYEAARAKDQPVVMAVVVLSSLMLLVSYLLRDLAYSLADPRVRRE